MRTKNHPVAALAAALAGAATLNGVAAAGQVLVTMDQVRPHKLDAPAGEIVVGNPGIADVSVLDKSRIMLFGKAPGVTNIFIFDDAGEVIEDLKVRVEAVGRDMVVMNKGVARSTHNCASICEVTLTIGDEFVNFQNTVQQAQQKLMQARDAAQ